MPPTIPTMTFPTAPHASPLVMMPASQPANAADQAETRRCRSATSGLDPTASQAFRGGGFDEQHLLYDVDQTVAEDLVLLLRRLFALGTLGHPLGKLGADYKREAVPNEDQVAPLRHGGSRCRPEHLPGLQTWTLLASRTYVKSDPSRKSAENPAVLDVGPRCEALEVGQDVPK